MKLSKLSIVSAAMALSVAAQQKGAPADFAQDLQQNYTGGKNKIIAAAEQMPEAGYSFQPTPEEMTFGKWVAHVADLQAQFCGVVSGSPKQLNAAQKTAKADLVAALKESFEICDKVYNETTMANRDEPVTTFRGPRPRGSWLWFNVGHNEECYGNMAVYTRLNKLVPPSSQGRSGQGKGKQ